MASVAEEPPLKLASFFIHVEKGRRRTGRSARSGIVVSWQSILGMSNGWLDAAELRPKSTLVGDLNEKRERLPHERIPCTCGAVSVVAIVRARCCEVFGGGTVEATDTVMPRMWEEQRDVMEDGRRKLVLVTWCGVASFEQRRKTKKEERRWANCLK